MNLPKPVLAAAWLGVFSLSGLGLVAWVHDHTQARIAANERAALLQALEILVPPASFDNDILADSLSVEDAALDPRQAVTVYRARKHGQPVAAVLSPTAPDGYNGAIKLLVAIGADGVLAGVRVVAHRETPGLGDPIDADKSDWILGFAGRSLSDPPEPRWRVKRDGGDFDQFTGATITPRAVVGAVRRSLVFFGRNRARLFAETQGE
ncbi:electron transport complex subunit RsxG [Methylomagnum ishizawai]|uniref:electron transport complex subunit RsxG n=1 Tax=Methylomagnum ishizawai TaxID=1760988 RepID=UPI001C7E46CA|nr:electron transport complex subunit RsxG [Methylomagnum ishizawai]